MPMISQRALAKSSLALGETQMSSKSATGKGKLGWILSTASIAAMGALTPAFAQEEEISDEIVVTATGRSAAIQDVPIAVTAIGHEALENAGVNTLIDLRQVTPNLRIGSGQSQTSGTSASIRGIGTGSDNPGFEAAVGIFIDGVYRARTGAAINDLADVERIEILRGPQGTLYGKNTTAGAISVVTAGPDFDPGMWLEAGAGDLGTGSMQAGGNLPLSDSFALRFDGTLRTRDGYIDNATTPGDTINTTDRWSTRLQAQWDISDAASLRVIVDNAETDEACCAAVTLGDTTNILAANGSFPFSVAMNLTQPGSILTPSVFPAPIAANPEARRTSLSTNRSYAESSEDSGISGQLDWELGDINLTSITASRKWDSVRDQDIDFSAMDRAYRDDLEVGVESFTQEIRLQGEFGRVNWLIGGFYGDETVTQTDTIRYGTQAGAYVNNLLGLIDFTAAGAPNINGALPGTGQGVFGCNPGLGQCAIPFVLGTFNAVFGAGANALVPGTSAALAGTIPLTLGLSAANLNNAGQQGDSWGVDTTTLAIFTHNEISLTDDLVLTVGVRYTQEEKVMSADLNATQPACDAIRANRDVAYAALVFEQVARASLPAGHPLRTLAIGFPSALTLTCNPAVNNVQALQNGGVYAADFTDDAISGTVSLAYHLTDDMLVYGGYSRGFKSGGFNIDQSGMAVRPWTTTGGAAALSPYAQSVVAFLAALPAPIQMPTSFGADDLDFDPETIDAYELGLKSTFGPITLNLAGYYQQLHEYQLNAFNGFNFITRNVPEVVSQGFEAELSARPTDEIMLTLGAHYSDVTYDSTVAFAGNQGNPDDVVRAGDPLSQSPEWTITGSALYEIPLGDSLKLTLYGNGRYVSEYRLQTLGRNPLTDQPSFTIFDGRVALGSPSGRWAVELWGRNLTDEYYSIGAFAVPEQTIFNDQTQLRQGVFAAYPNEPATYGVTLRARY
jgi:iron complex outermembrane recepter protein